MFVSECVCVREREREEERKEVSEERGRKFLSDIARAAISGSHQIWCTRNWME